MILLHAGLIAQRHDGGWRGVLIEGPSGIGKSDLALRALDFGFRLVADDRVIVFTSCGRLFGRSPATLRGLIEIRGVGVLGLPHLDCVPIAMGITCRLQSDIERAPAAARREILDVTFPMIGLAPLEDSAPAKLCRALEVLGSRAQQDYDAAFPRTGRREST